MFEFYLEKYVMFSGQTISPDSSPYIFILLLAAIPGSLFVSRLIVKPLVGFLYLRFSRLLKFLWPVFRHNNEPYGIAALSVAILALSIQLATFLREGDELELLLRCDRANEFTADSEYVYVSVDCAIKNSGNLTATIDSVEPTFYFSDRIDLSRGHTERSNHHYGGDSASLVSEEFRLPQSLHSGITKLFSTSVAIPISPFRRARSNSEIVTTMPAPEILDGLQGFSMCLESGSPNKCFYELTGKYLPNYIYETIEMPAGGGLIDLINGVGVSVSDFEYIVEVEINMMAGSFPFDYNDAIPLLSFSDENFKNLNLPWWKKEYGIWHVNSDGSKSGIYLNFIHATIIYLLIITAILGWCFIIMKLYSRVFPKNDPQGS